ncbi:MAG: hypothetical protein ACI4VF_01895 [Lachnospirales bacterium]
MLFRLFNNKYVFRIDSFFKNVKEYGLNNTVKRHFRSKNKSYESIKNGFKDQKSIKMSELIENKCGSDFKIETYFNIGYCVFGPVIYEFMEWLYNETLNYNELWFLSREGWLLKKAFDIYCKNKNISFIKTKYFLSSRRASSVASIENINDIKEILSQYYKGSINNLLFSRLGINIDYDFYVEMPKDVEKVMKYVNIKDVISKAQKEKNNYISYCKGFDYNNAAVVDVGYSGTIQFYLSKLLNKKIDGFYLSTHFNNKPQKIGCKCESLFPVYNTLHERVNFIFKNQLYFEAVLKAPFGQLISFDNSIKPIYTDDFLIEKEIEEIQNGICHFIDDMGANFKKSRKNTFAVELFDFAFNYGVIKKELLNKLTVEDKYCSDGNHKISELVSNNN